MATDKGVAAGLAWDDMSDGVCQAATLSVAIRGQQNFRQAGHGIGFGVISATPLLKEGDAASGADSQDVSDWPTNQPVPTPRTKDN